MQTDFLDIAEHEESIFDFSALNDFLEILVFDQILVDQFLCLRKRHPEDKVSFQRQFCHLQGSTCGLGAHILENVCFGPSQEMTFIHLAYLLT